MKVLRLVDRDTRQAKCVVIDDLRKDIIGPILRENIACEAVLNTDEASYSAKVGEQFSGHEVVKRHAKEYVRGDA